MGGGFVKLGQILSMRQDVLPVEYTEELLNLLTNLPQAPYEEIEKLLVAALGEPVETFFQEFNRVPIASASIAQVYRARLHDGKEVAVKVQKPNAKAEFEVDMVLAGFLGDLFGIVSFFRSLPLQDVVDEFVASTTSELDFRNEAKNGMAMREHCKRFHETVFPFVYLNHSSEKVLITEFLDNIYTAEQILRLVEKDASAAHRLKVEEDIDVEEVVYRFVIDGMRQYFVDGFFHADPHPGNIFILPGSRIGYFDFGIMGRASEKRMTAVRILRSLMEKDPHGIARHMLDYARTVFAEELEILKKGKNPIDDRYELAIKKIEEIMADNFAVDLQSILTPWYDAFEKKFTEEEGNKTMLRHKSFSVVFSKIVMEAESYNIHLPREMVMFMRSLSIADMVALRLNPKFDMTKAIKRFFAEYPLSETEQIIEESSHQRDIEEGGVEPITEQSFDALLEIRGREEERALAAREKLIDLISRYAEEYDEVRQILKQ